MIGPGVVTYPVVNGIVGIPGPFGPKLPYGPVIAVFGIEEGDKFIEGVAVSQPGISLGGPGAIWLSVIALAHNAMMMVPVAKRKKAGEIHH